MEPATSSMVLIGSSLSILPKKMVQRIIAGEFVDFKDLPPAKSWLPAFRDNQALTLQLQEVEKQRKLILDYITWSQCFAVYAAVLGSDQPQNSCNISTRWPTLPENTNGPPGLSSRYSSWQLIPIFQSLAVAELGPLEYLQV